MELSQRLREMQQTCPTMEHSQQLYSKKKKITNVQYRTEGIFPGPVRRDFSKKTHTLPPPLLLEILQLLKFNTFIVIF